MGSFPQHKEVVYPSFFTLRQQRGKGSEVSFHIFQIRSLFISSFTFTIDTHSLFSVMVSYFSVLNSAYRHISLVMENFEE